MTLYETAHDVLAENTARKYDGWLIDLQTANAIVTVYLALSPDNRRRFDDGRLVDFVWRAVS